MSPDPQGAGEDRLPDEEYIYGAYRLDAAIRDLRAARKLFNGSRQPVAAEMTAAVSELLERADRAWVKANAGWPMTDPRTLTDVDAATVGAMRELLGQRRDELSPVEFARLVAHLSDYLDGLGDGLEVRR